MSAEHHHGNTPAAWTAVIIMMVAFVVGTLGVMVAAPVVFWVGVALFVIGAIVGKVMSMMGLGKNPKAGATA